MAKQYPPALCRLIAAPLVGDATVRFTSAVSNDLGRPIEEVHEWALLFSRSSGSLFPVCARRQLTKQHLRVGSPKCGLLTADARHLLVFSLPHGSEADLAATSPLLTLSRRVRAPVLS